MSIASPAPGLRVQNKGADDLACTTFDDKPCLCESEGNWIWWAVRFGGLEALDRWIYLNQKGDLIRDLCGFRWVVNRSPPRSLYVQKGLLKLLWVGLNEERLKWTNGTGFWVGSYAS